ncbi:MAG: hypothetical protein HY775_11375 [Acidobacteria bacterium]|nr:hypothetical protein [Acidobacteriota bacterium]
MFVLLLALVWAVVLVPSLFRTRLESSPIDGVRSFERSMGVLANARRRGQALSGRWVMVPRDVTAPRSRRRRVVRRRRTTFERLVAAAGATFVLGLVPQLRWLLLVHLAIDAVLGGYAARLIQWKQDEERRTPAARPYPVEDAYPDRAVGQ